MLIFILSQLVTMGISLKIKFKTFTKTYEDIGNKGYKIDSDKMREIDETVNSGKKLVGDIFDCICFLIPGINVINAAVRSSINKKAFNDRLIKKDALISMTEIEKKYYDSLDNTAQRVNFVSYQKNIESAINDLKIFLDDEEIVLEKNIAQLYYEKLPPISYTLEEIKKLSDSIDSYYKLGKLEGVNTAIIGLPNDDCIIKEIILKKEKSLKKLEYQTLDEQCVKDERFVVYPFGFDFEENNILKNCYQEIVSIRDNCRKNYNGNIVDNVYSIDNKVKIYVKRK